MWSTSGQLTTGPPPTEESGPLAENTPLTDCEPKLPDDFHYSETSEMIFLGRIRRRGALVLV